MLICDLAKIYSEDNFNHQTVQAPLNRGLLAAPASPAPSTHCSDRVPSYIAFRKVDKTRSLAIKHHNLLRR